MGSEVPDSKLQPGTLPGLSAQEHHMGLATGVKASLMQPPPTTPLPQALERLCCKDRPQVAPAKSDMEEEVHSSHSRAPTEHKLLYRQGQSRAPWRGHCTH